MRQCIPASCSDWYFDQMMDLQDVPETEKSAYTDKTKSIPQADPNDLLNPAIQENINHQVRNSMNVIMGFAQILHREDISREDTRLYTGMICSETEQLLHVFKELLNNLRKIQS